MYYVEHKRIKAFSDEEYQNWLEKKKKGKELESSIDDSENQKTSTEN